MSEAFLQVLLILAYLAIGLISVTFPIYAICAAYLKQEKWESEKERKKRMEKLRVRISKLTAELKGEEPDSEQVTQLKEQIEKYESELEGIELGVRYLTAEGAVRNPIIGLVLALVAAGAGIHFFYEGSQQNVALCGCVSGIISALALLNLYKTISAVEHAALRPARTIEFEICYPSGEKSQKIKRAKKTKLLIGAKPEGDIDNVEFCIFLPPEVHLEGISTVEAYNTLQPKKSTHPNHNMIVVEHSFLPAGMFLGIGFEVSSKKSGKYVIPVTVCGKGIYRYKTELILNVIE